MKYLLSNLSLESTRRLFIIVDIISVVLSLQIGYLLTPFNSAETATSDSYNESFNYMLLIVAPMIIVTVNHSLLLHEPREVNFLSLVYAVKQLIGITLGFVLSYALMYLVEYALIGRYVTLYSILSATILNLFCKMIIKSKIQPNKSVIGIISTKADFIMISKYLNIEVLHIKNREILKKLKAQNQFAEVVEFATCHNHEDKFNLTDLINYSLFEGLRVRTLHDWIEANEQKIPVDFISHDWFVSKDVNRHLMSYLWFKTLIDKFIALLILSASVPILVASYILLKLDDGGPYIYSQKRLGLYGSQFYLYKIRSMNLNAERNGAQWAGENDMRVTRLGRIIRKLRIDELPQLINVLKGEMSIVGPRPERGDLADQIESRYPLFKQRLLIKPGLTGWAQINYPYGASIEDGKKKLEYDLYYLKNISLLLDLQIITRTIASITKGSR